MYRIISVIGGSAARLKEASLALDTVENYIGAGALVVLLSCAVVANASTASSPPDPKHDLGRCVGRGTKV